MKTTFSRALASLLMLLFALSPVWATCGGGGEWHGRRKWRRRYNGGLRRCVQRSLENLGSQNRTSERVVLYWFPASNDEVKNRL
jgi:hypothetical protein